MSLRPAVFLAALFVLPRPGAAQDAPPKPENPPKVAGVDVPAPKRIKAVRPQYPPEAQAVGLRGIVILELVVGPDGKVVSARVTRSVPPFDEAALTAVRQWEYEITKVDGKPVSVVLTVPIEFKMNMPQMARDEGIPELRQGVAPAFPAGVEVERATVTADVTLDPDGHVAEAHIKSGDSPWSESVIHALQTWRFTPLEGPGTIAFEVRAEFASGGRGGPRVDLRLSGPRRIGPPSAAASASPVPPSSSPAPAAVVSPRPSPTPPTPASPAAASPEPAPRVASPSPAAVPTPAPATTPPAAAPPRPAAPPEELIRNPAGGAPASSPPTLPPAPGMPAAPTPVPVPTATPAPPPPGISAIRDVTLAPGVPDLMKGRRPVAPPLARMQGISGTVEVRFAVDAAGSATVREVTGPDQLKEAARQTVASWSFRRTTPERLFLGATFTYKGDAAAAAVRAQE